MPICPHCQKRILPRQTFADLLCLDRVCLRCRRLGEVPLKKEILPLAGKECHLYSFHEEDHPALTARVFALMVRKDRAVVFFEEGMLEDTVALAHLAGLFTPVELYRAEFFTMDEIESLLAGLDPDA